MAFPMTKASMEERGPDALALATLLGDDPACPCGGTGTSAAHAREHLRWARGVPLSSAAELARICSTHDRGSLLPVTQSAPTPLRRLAYEVGLLFRRENRYDFPPLPFPGRGGARWTDDPVA